MNLRSIEPDDIDVIKGIHEKYYSKEFSFEEFKRNYYSAFLVEDNGIIISAGGIRPIVEVVMVTNKDFHPEDRKTALFLMLDAAIMNAKNLGHSAIHAFVSDPTWSNRLKRTGFQSPKGECLIFKF